MQLPLIKATTDSKRISLTIQSDGTMVIEKTGGEAGIDLTFDEMSFLTDYLIRFVGEAQKRREYVVWRQGISASDV